jgi:hypothetical protein
VVVNFDRPWGHCGPGAIMGLEIMALEIMALKIMAHGFSPRTSER